MLEAEGFDPSPAAGQSLSDSAHRAMLDMILKGEFVAGDPIQERRLAEQLKISRTPVREALNRLQSEGLITADGSRSLKIAQISIGDFAEILNVRRLLEVEAAGLAAARGVRAEDAEKVRAAIAGLLAMPEPTPGHHWAVDDFVHGLVSKAAHNRHMADTILDLRRRTHVFNTRRLPQRLRPGAEEHRAIVDAVASGDAAAARDAMAVHIDNVKRAIIDQLLSCERLR